MDVAGPRVRRRGFVVIHTDPNLDLEDDSESAEGVTVRVRIARPKLQRQIAVTSSRTSETSLVAVVHSSLSRVRQTAAGSKAQGSDQ